MTTATENRIDEKKESQMLDLLRSLLRSKNDQIDAYQKYLAGEGEFHDAGEDVVNFREMLQERCEDEFAATGRLGRQLTTEAMGFEYLPAEVSFSFHDDKTEVQVNATLRMADDTCTVWDIETETEEV